MASSRYSLCIRINLKHYPNPMVMKNLLLYRVFLICLLALAWPSTAHARATVFEHQAGHPLVAQQEVIEQQQFPSRQAASQRPEQHSDWQQPEQENATEQQTTTDAATPREAIDDGAPASPSTQTGSFINQSSRQPFAPPHQSRNGVITITPSTALKNSSQQSLGGEEGEENSVTQWSSTATKAIVKYHEPEEPKAPTGAPQLRPLQ